MSFRFSNSSSSSRYWIIAILISAAAMLALPSASQAEPVPIDPGLTTTKEEKKYPEVDQAREKLAVGDLDAAMEILKGAAKKYPELMTPRMVIATMFFSANQPRQGRSQLEKAVVESPEDPEAYVLMGDLALAEGRATEGAMLYDKAVSLMANYKGNADKKKALFQRSHMGAAMAASQHEKWQLARQHLDTLLKTNPDFTRGHLELARILFELKQPEKDVFNELKTAYRLDAKLASPEVMMGNLYESSGDRTAADKWMQNAIQASPKDLKTRLQYAQWLLATGRTPEAVPQVEEAIKLDPASNEALVLAGRISRFAKNYPQALKHLQKAYLELPANPGVANELALTLIEVGDEPSRQRAESLAVANQRQNPNNLEVIATLGYIWYRLGRMDEAERCLSAIKNSGGQVNADQAYFCARIADARGQSAQAREWVDNALKTTGPFAYRKEAELLSQQLARRAAPPATGPGPSASK